jgi:ethanolamine utilization cobalamin adenosyltransferase
LVGLEAKDIRFHSHHTHELYGVPFMFPSVRQGPVVAKLNLARAYAREAEVALYGAFPSPSERDDLKLALNRLSSALYLMAVRFLAGRLGAAPRPGPVKGWKPPDKNAKIGRPE